MIVKILGNPVQYGKIVNGPFLNRRKEEPITRAELERSFFVVQLLPEYREPYNDDGIREIDYKDIERKT